MTIIHRRTNRVIYGMNSCFYEACKLNLEMTAFQDYHNWTMHQSVFRVRLYCSHCGEQEEVQGWLRPVTGDKLQMNPINPCSIAFMPPCLTGIKTLKMLLKKD